MGDSEQTVTQSLRRKICEMTDYRSIANPPYKSYSQPKAQNWIKLKNDSHVEYFRCHNDKECLIMRECDRQLLISRKQDDDRDSDEEVMFNAVQYNFKNLVQALSQENGRTYSWREYF